jgi:hypothetical protein
VETLASSLAQKAVKTVALAPRGLAEATLVGVEKVEERAGAGWGTVRSAEAEVGGEPVARRVEALEEQKEATMAALRGAPRGLETVAQREALMGEARQQTLRAEGMVVVSGG